MKQTIVRIPHPILTENAKQVVSFDKKLKNLIIRMTQALTSAKNPKGVGIAAPQIGEPYRVFIIRPTEKSPMRVFINPEIVSMSNDKTDGVPERDNKLEGCLSIPEIWGTVARSSSLTLRYQDETGATHTEEFSGFPATIVQHETDHINGILFTHRVLEQKGTFYRNAKDKNGKDILEEIELS